MDTVKSAIPVMEKVKQADSPPVYNEENAEIVPEGGLLSMPRTGYRAAKRMFDIFFSAFFLLLLLPVFAVVSALIAIDSRGPVFYTQVRMGKNGKPFRILKFRSMCRGADSLIKSFSPEQRAEYYANYKLSNDFRITRVGRVLRRTNMDELPQLVNILLGQLSFVGPRPVVGEELLKYGCRKALFLSVKPGLTGYWQVRRGADTSYGERVDMELYYVAHRSFIMDMRILLETLALVARG